MYFDVKTGLCERPLSVKMNEWVKVDSKLHVIIPGPSTNRDGMYDCSGTKSIGDFASKSKIGFLHVLPAAFFSKLLQSNMVH